MMAIRSRRLCCGKPPLGCGAKKALASEKKVSPTRRGVGQRVSVQWLGMPPRPRGILRTILAPQGRESSRDVAPPVGRLDGGLLPDEAVRRRPTASS